MNSECEQFVRKNNGSILIEVIASIMMLSAVGIIILSACLRCREEYENRIREDKLNMAVNMLIKEIKYNITENELEELFKDRNDFAIKYDDHLGEKISSEDIRNLERGADIKIEKVTDNSRKTEYKIIVNVKNEDLNIEREYEFYKSWWMDEV